jgi:hypothetical protein
VGTQSGREVSRGGLLLPLLLLGALTLPAGLPAQFRASALGSVSQTIDGTRITVEFSRPQARGRDSLFGGVVKWGEVWTPGANWATTLEVSRAVKLDGHAVAQGKYSVWLVVRPAASWTLVLDPRAHRFHMNPPDSTPEQIRFAVRPEPRPFVEVLTWWFPADRPTGTTLAMQWGTTYLAFEVEVAPSHPLTIAADKAEPFVGIYELHWLSPSGSLPPGMTIMEQPLSSEPVSFTISHEGGRLVARWQLGPGLRTVTIVLVPLTDDSFLTGFLDAKGSVRDLETEMVFEFVLASGRATRFEIRGLGDILLATADRKG